MHKILDSIQPVIAKSKNVRINESALNDFCNAIQAEDFSSKLNIDEYTLPGNRSEEDYIAFCVILQSLNFSYWGEPKWMVTFEGKDYTSGSVSLEKALKRALIDGIDILNPAFLQNISEDTFANILRGSGTIPLFTERLAIVRELGKRIIETCEGKFSTILTATNGQAEKIVELLTTSFPSIFADEAAYNDKKVYFYKRAQLVPVYLAELTTAKQMSFTITGMDWITALADYKIPQLLRECGIVEYLPTLVNKVDTKLELASGEEDEVEIRAHCIWAITMITEKLRAKFPKKDITPTHINQLFWAQRKDVGADGKPHHRVRTIWY